jgi:hypothetical protein
MSITLLHKMKHADDPLILKGSGGSYRNLREMRSNVDFGLRQVDEAAGTPRYTVATRSVATGRGTALANAGIEEVRPAACHSAPGVPPPVC